MSLIGAIFRKNLMIQKRKMMKTVWFMALPIIVFCLLLLLQTSNDSKDTGPYPTSTVLTGNNQSLVEALRGNMFSNSSAVSSFEGQKAYDILNSNGSVLNVTVWCSSSMNFWEVSHLVNLVTNAYLNYVRGPETNCILFDVVEPVTPSRSQYLRLATPPIFTWVILLQFYLVVTSLIDEKAQELRMIMQIHGVRDLSIMAIKYLYMECVSILYMLLLVIVGSLTGVKFFTQNDYFVQFLMYSLLINLYSMIAVAFGQISNIHKAIWWASIWGTGILGFSLFQSLVESDTNSRFWMIVMELYPGFALYRVLFEFSQIEYTNGIRWQDLKDSTNGIREVMIILIVEWFAALAIAHYLGRCKKGRLSSVLDQESDVQIHMEQPEVRHEREKVERMLRHCDTNNVVICYNLKKVYQVKNGREKFAAKNMSLALARGECFGMIGIRGAGKTSFIHMVTGLTTPTSGKAFFQGSSMGVCLQKNLLWETLTGREHLLFYGRLRNLRGWTLTQAVEECLRTAHLSYGDVADKQVSEYSKGMKRRMSIAISLIGDPEVLFIDEPSAGLDTTSRHNLWGVVKRLKQDRTVILTTKSTEEAEALCDRVGVLVDGTLECVGDPKMMVNYFVRLFQV